MVEKSIFPLLRVCNFSIAFDLKKNLVAKFFYFKLANFLGLYAN
jgi:hypothetical protein